MVIGQRPLNASTQHREDTTKVPIKSSKTNGIKCCSVKTRKFFNDKFLVSQWSVPAVHAADYTNHLHLISLYSLSSCVFCYKLSNFLRHIPFLSSNDDDVCSRHTGHSSFLNIHE